MTAELAVAMTGVVLLLSTFVSAVSVGQAQLRAHDAASAGARAAARGEAEDVVLGLTRRLAGVGSTAVIAHTGSMVTVRVTVPVELPLPGSPLVTIRGTASTPAEAQLAGG